MDAFRIGRCRSDYTDWYSLSAKGFYAYDWDVWHGPYRRICSPTVPVTIDALPSVIRSAAHLAVFRLDFATETGVTVEPST